MLGPHRLPCETPQAHRAKAAPVAAARWVLPATILGSSLGFIDASVVNVALPAIREDLGSGLAAMQWVANSYMLALAALILVGGSAADRFGRRRIFVLGLWVFAAASVACAAAPSVSWLVAARFLQGIAAALLTPASLALIGAAYAGEARGRAIGTWAAAGALTTALGPALGGWLVDSVGWRAIFYINLPVAAAALFLALKLAPDRGADESEPLDARGSALAVLALGLVCYGLIAAGEGSRNAGVAALIAALPVAWLFLRFEARAAAPMMPLSLFRNRQFSGANGLTVLLYAALTGALFLLPFVLIEVHGYSAMAAGAAFLPFSVIMGLGSRWSGALKDRIGARLPLIAGPAVAAAGFALLGVSSGSSYWSVYLPGLIVLAAGMTLAVAPLTAAVFDAAPEERSGTAAGINSAAARAGGLVAVAALGLAYGGGDLAQAYRIVMFAAAAAAALSALTAALTVR